MKGLQGDACIPRERYDIDTIPVCTDVDPSMSCISDQVLPFSSESYFSSCPFSFSIFHFLGYLYLRIGHSTLHTELEPLLRAGGAIIHVSYSPLQQVSSVLRWFAGMAVARECRLLVQLELHTIPRRIINNSIKNNNTVRPIQ